MIGQESSSIYRDGQYWGSRIVRVEIPKGWDDETRARARHLVENFSAGANPKAILDALMELKLTTANRNMGEADMEAQLAIYSRELLRYPQDIALEVLRQRRQWWPTLKELTDPCEDLMTTRTMLKHALRP